MDLRDITFTLPLRGQTCTVTGRVFMNDEDAWQLHDYIPTIGDERISTGMQEVEGEAPVDEGDLIAAAAVAAAQEQFDE